MQKKHSRVLLAGVVATAVLAAVLNQTFADNAKDKDITPPDKKAKAADNSGKADKIGLPVYAPSTYWIGIRLVPVPEILLPQFGVKDENSSLGVVENVVEKSPADKAGVKRGDVVLSFGDKDINTLEDLVEQVAKAKNTAQKLIIYREGKKTELTVTPEERPKEQFTMGGFVPPAQGMPFKNMPPNMPQPKWEKVPGMRLGPEMWLGQKNPREMMKEMEEYFRSMQGGNDADQFVLVPEDEDNETGNTVANSLGGNSKQLFVTTKTEDGKTKITVRKVIKNDGETKENVYEADSYEELPEEIQKEVKGLLGK